MSSTSSIPFLCCDKKSLYLPTDMPTLQFDYTLYFYPGIEDAKGRCMSTQLEINQSSAFQPDPQEQISRHACTECFVSYSWSRRPQNEEAKTVSTERRISWKLKTSLLFKVEVESILPVGSAHKKKRPYEHVHNQNSWGVMFYKFFSSKLLFTLRTELPLKLNST